MFTYTRRTDCLRLAVVLLSGLGISVANADDSLPYPDQVRLAFETAQPGDVITIDAGVHEFNRTLTLNTDGVTIRGAGIDETVLTFKNQLAGAEGILVNASDFLIEDLAIEDTKGDGLKINEAENITIRRVRTEWTGGPSPENGGYGIYPVQASNVLIEESVAIAASDAGIYVGQSQNAVIRNNHVYDNVVGIEVENTAHADVYGNRSERNTGGIEVFNMPHLPVNGHSARVFDNEIVANNTPNFAGGEGVSAGLPPGVGLLINSIDKVEVFNNRLADNNTANVLIISYFATPYYGSRESVETFDPFPEEIFIHQNDYSGGGTAPAVPELEQLRQAMFGEDGKLPEVVWDGAVNPQNGETGAQICIGDEAAIVSVDAINGYQNILLNDAAHDCALPNLDPVTLAQ